MAQRAALALAVPLQHTLGATLLTPDSPADGVRFTVGELAGNGAGGLHAAALGAILELAGYLALLPHLTSTEHAITHAISTQLISAAGQGQVIEARGTVDRRTRRMGFISVLAQTGDAVLARAQLVKSVVALR